MAGCIHGPKDSTDTVNEGKDAAMVAQSILPLPHSTMHKGVPPLEVGEELRVGVFICHCEGIIGNVIDSPGLAQWASHLPNVAYNTDYIFMCSDPGQEFITEAIKEHKSNRVVSILKAPQ